MAAKPTPTTPAQSGPTTPEPESSVPATPSASASGVLGVTADEAARLKEPVNPGDSKAQQRDPEIPSGFEPPRPSIVALIAGRIGRTEEEVADALCSAVEMMLGGKSISGGIEENDVVAVDIGALAKGILDLYSNTGHSVPAGLRAALNEMKSGYCPAA